MAWVTIELSKAKDYVGVMNERCLELSCIAEKLFSVCNDMQYFGFHPGKDVFFYVTNLKKWCGNGKKYKIDFYRFEKE